MQTNLILIKKIFFCLLLNKNDNIITTQIIHKKEIIDSITSIIKI